MRNLFKAIMTAIVSLALMAAHAQVSVTATAGTTAGTYSTLNSAFAAINAGTHQGTLRINITGNTTEPSPPVSLLGSGTGSASYSSIYISPSGGDWVIHSATIPFAYRGIIEMIGAQHVTIDGDPAHTGVPHLTFEMVKTSNIEVSAIRLASADTFGSKGAAYDTIRSCNITGGLDSFTSTIPGYGIVCSGYDAMNTQTLGAYGCDHNAFISNTLTRVYYGIYLNGPQGKNIPTGDKSVLIKGNRFYGGYSDSAFIYGVYIHGFCLDGQPDQSIVIDSNDFTKHGLNTATGIYEENMSGPVVFSNNNFHDMSDGFQAIYSYPHPSAPYRTYAHLSLCIGNTLQNGGGSLFYQYDPNNGLPRDTTIIRGNYIHDISTGYNNSIIQGFGAVYLIDHNRINNVTTEQDALVGISLISSSCNCIGNIDANEISGLTNLTSALGIIGGAIGIQTNGAYRISNNMISGISSQMIAHGYRTIGMMIDSGSTCVNNTISLNVPNQPGSDSTTGSYCIYTAGGRSTFTNNILSNEQSHCIPYGLYLDGSVYSTNRMDYNDYYVPNGNVGYAGVDRPTLLHWQAALSQDLHSVSRPVAFRSTSDMHIDTMSAGAYYVFRSGIATDNTWDIDRQARFNPPCIGADEFGSFVAPPDSLVWPGDADANHYVDNTDLLPIGLAYDSAGPSRAVQGIVWQGDLAVNWNDSFSIYAPYTDYKHADCNGDGLINASDTTAIITNFSLAHAKTNGPQPNRSGLPILKALLSADTLYTGDTLTATFILGDNALPANNIYGLAFTYNFDPTVVDSAFTTMSIGSSWLGSTDKIAISKILNAPGQIKAAITRINHTNRSGNGAIAVAKFKITTDNISGKDYSYYANMGYISDITAIDAQGNTIQLNASADTSQVGYEPTGIREVAVANISLYPNPANGKVTLLADDPITAVSITDVAGQEVYQKTVASAKSWTIDMPATMSDGIYFVHVKTTRAAGIAKLSVIR